MATAFIVALLYALTGNTGRDTFLFLFGISMFTYQTVLLSLLQEEAQKKLTNNMTSDNRNKRKPIRMPR